MSRKPGHAPSYRPAMMQSFQGSQTGGATTQPAATAGVSQTTASGESTQTRPLVGMNPPPPPPFDSEPLPLPPPDPPCHQPRPQSFDPHAQSFQPYNRPQPPPTAYGPQSTPYGHNYMPQHLVGGYAQQAFQHVHNQLQPKPYSLPHSALPPRAPYSAGYYQALAGYVQPQLPSNSYQTGHTVGPPYGLQQSLVPQMPPVQIEPQSQAQRPRQSNRSNPRVRKGGGGGLSFTQDNSRQSARPPSNSNTGIPPNASSGPPNTNTESAGSEVPSWRRGQGSRLTSMDPLVATPALQRHDRDGSMQTEIQPPATATEVESSVPQQQQVSRTTQTEEPSIPDDTDRTVPGRASSADLSNVLEDPVAGTPERAPTPVQAQIHNSPSLSADEADSSLEPIQTPAITSIPTGTIQADSSPVRALIHESPSADEADSLFDHTPTRTITSTSTGTVRASSPPAPPIPNPHPITQILFTDLAPSTQLVPPSGPPKFALNTIVKLLSDFRLPLKDVHEGMWGTVERVAWFPHYLTYICFIRLLDMPPLMREAQASEAAQLGGPNESILLASEIQLQPYTPSLVVGEKVSVRGLGDLSADAVSRWAQTPPYMPYATHTQACMAEMLRGMRAMGAEAGEWSEREWVVVRVRAVVRNWYLTYRVECRVMSGGEGGEGGAEGQWWEECDVRRGESAEEESEVETGAEGSGEMRSE